MPKLLPFVLGILGFGISSSKAEAGHYIKVITAYPASLEMIIAAGSHHSSFANAKVGRGVKNQPPLLIRAPCFDSI
jgi:hypothetical protein